jgi:tetratricopeptide (TPR) repeat protein
VLRAPLPRCLALLLRRSRAAGLVAAGLLAASIASALTLNPSAGEIEQQYRRGDTAAALKRLDEALAAQPGDATLRFLQAVLASEAGRHDEAAKLFERMTQDYPELPEPYNNLAVLHAAAGRLDSARELLDTALRLDPGYRTAHENQGDVLVRLAARAYAAAADGTRAEPLLLRKLQLARELGSLR